jgi:hypothetical protein
MPTRNPTKHKSQPEELPTQEAVRPKRRKVGQVGSEVIYQLDEPTSCLDCFKSIPSGSLVTIQNVSTDLCKVPVCMYFSKLGSGNLKLTGKVKESRVCSCPAFETGEVASRGKYAKAVRAQFS